MKTSRRNFISTTALAGGAAILPSCGKTKTRISENFVDYTKLDTALKKPVLKRELLSEPVIIESV